MSRGLILSCSCSKKPSELPLPAVERYDGPAFRVLRRFLRKAELPPPAIRILSAEFGLIAPDENISFYDRRMTKSRADELQPAITASFEPFWKSNQIDDLMVVASSHYVEALAGCFLMVSDGVTVNVTSGSIGRQVSVLHDWLHGGPPTIADAGRIKDVKFRGKIIQQTAAEVLDVARREYPGDLRMASRYETWCVHVDDHLVAPKWLVSKLTGFPVGQFRTADALSVLRKLGVEATRVPPELRAHAFKKEAR